MTDATWPVPEGYEDSSCGCLSAQADGWRWEVRERVEGDPAPLWVYVKMGLAFRSDPAVYRIAHGNPEGREVKRGDGVWKIPRGADIWGSCKADSPKQWIPSIHSGSASLPGKYYKMPEAAPPAESEIVEPSDASPCSIPAICAAWLTANGYDGLCDPDIECGCSVIDLMPCNSPGLNTCVPAHKELQDDGDWLMFPGKSNMSREPRGPAPGAAP